MIAESLLVVVGQDILRDIRDTLRVKQRFLYIYRRDFLVRNAGLAIHGLDILHAERQHVIIRYRRDNGISMQPLTEDLLGCKEFIRRIVREDRRAGKTEDMIAFEPFDDLVVHLAELRTVALVKDDHHMPAIDRMLFLFLAEGVEFLNGGDDDTVVVVAHLLGQNRCGFIGRDATFLELLIFANGLIIQILSVHHKQHFVHIIQLRA